MKYFYSLIFLLTISFVAKSQVDLDTAPDFSAKDVHGGLHHLYEYLDAENLVVIDFFTTNCGPCQTYASHVSASYEYFGCNFSNVKYLGINWGSDNVAVLEFDQLWGANYPSISGLQGGGNAVVDLYQVQSYPTVILIAPDRSILHNHIWPPEQSTLNALVLEAGGIPMLCTVNTNELYTNEPPLLTATNSASGAVTLSLNAQVKPGMSLLIYAADGRLVYEQAVENETITFNLRAGVYVAALLQNRSKISTLRFMSH
ncbi:MAG: peroxiredoxin family protein [Lentimicrobium sp.]|nr:peroxiredoxin family protein [Lentimicrobium sp.]